MAKTSTYLTPPQYAKRLGVKPDKVVGWINAGELRAVNTASSRTGRPRWRIPPDAIIEFENARAAKPPVKRTQQSKKRNHLIEYF